MLEYAMGVCIISKGGKLIMIVIFDQPEVKQSIKRQRIKSDAEVDLTAAEYLGQVAKILVAGNNRLMHQSDTCPNLNKDFFYIQC